MSRFIAFGIAIACLFTIAFAAVPGDLITSLPGFGVPPTKHYSGLLPADAAKTVFLHYWFVESAGNPATDPVVVWMNGGPGCSSLEGYMYELGPFNFNGSTDANGLPQLAVNPYGWNQIANVIFLEHPAGVGFSYAVNGSTTTDDFVQSQNTYGFMLSWFAAYPEYAKNEFYITGESYAGIYVPTLANRILMGNQAGNPYINLIGFAVGNGCIGNSVGTCGNDFDADKIEVDFFAGHSMISQDLYAAINKACGDFSNESQACQALLGQVDVGDIDIYNVYDVCGNDQANIRTPLSSVIGRAPNKAAKKIAQDAVVCIPSAYGSTYLNDMSVRKAIHVDNVNLSSWTVCPGVDYNANLVSLLPTYPSLIQAYRVLIYSGDADACVPYNGSEEWTRNLGIKVVNPWSGYQVTSGGSTHVAGYVTEYQGGKNGNFFYATVKHAGHMVPKYEPEAGFHMFQSWLKNQPF